MVHHEQAVYLMFLCEEAVILELGLQIIAACARCFRGLRHSLNGLLTLQDKVAVGVAIVLCAPQLGRLATGDGVRVPGIEGKRAAEAQALSDEVEFLVKGYVGLHLVLPDGFVTCLCEQKLGGFLSVYDGPLASAPLAGR